MTDGGGIDSTRAADEQGPIFDPRHDPVFQRGYDPAASVPPAAPAHPSRRAGRARPADPSVPAPLTPLTPPNRDLSTFPAVGEVLNSRLGEDSEAPADVAGHVPPVPDTAAGESRRNPFIVALWIIGASLVVGGITLQWQATLNSYRGPGFDAEHIPLEVILQQLVWTIAPASVSVGAMTLVGLVFWHAVTWRVARPAAGDAGAEDWPHQNHNA